MWTLGPYTGLTISPFPAFARVACIACCCGMRGHWNVGCVYGEGLGFCCRVINAGRVERPCLPRQCWRIRRATSFPRERYRTGWGTSIPTSFLTRLGPQESQLWRLGAALRKVMPASDGYFILAVGNDPTFQRFVAVADKARGGRAGGDEPNPERSASGGSSGEGSGTAGRRPLQLAVCPRGESVRDQSWHRVCFETNLGPLAPENAAGSWSRTPAMP